MIPSSVVSSLHEIFNSRARSHVTSEYSSKRLTGLKKRHLKEILVKLSHEIFRKFETIQTLERPMEPLKPSLMQENAELETAILQRAAELRSLRELRIAEAKQLLAEEIKKKQNEIKAKSAESAASASSSLQVLAIDSDRFKFAQNALMELSGPAAIAKLKHELEMLTHLDTHIKQTLKSSDSPALSAVLSSVQLDLQKSKSDPPGKTTKKMSAALASRLASPY